MTSTASRGPTEVPKDPGEQLAKLAKLGQTCPEYTAVGSAAHNELGAAVARLNQKFSNPEQVKKFTVLPRDLSVDHGELTPTLKFPQEANPRELGRRYRSDVR
ncbi:MAG: hypothetical protein CM1200mP32_06400 [Methanobacteriota archaeon]|nr:MAG: hypothetical protein CM1200mP32_06400 [Euryarchaeota archaeon]